MAAEFLPSALSHFDPTDLFDALSTGIIVLDAQLCPIYANVAAQDLLAFSLNKARGRPFGDFLHDSNGLLSNLRRVLQTGDGQTGNLLAIFGWHHNSRKLVAVTPVVASEGHVN